LQLVQEEKFLVPLVKEERSPLDPKEVEKSYVSQISIQAEVQHSLPILMLESISFNPNLHIIMELPTSKASSSTTKSFDTDNMLTSESFREDCRDIIPLQFGAKEDKIVLSLRAIEMGQMRMKICKESLYQIRSQL
jgi:hypothetical protein